MLAFWRPAFWIAAEVVVLTPRRSSWVSALRGRQRAGIRGGSVLVPWRPAFWNDAEVVGHLFRQS